MSLKDEADLVEQIIGHSSVDNPVETALRTDQRVIARVTDGIYRKPVSALRELISNAFDADATRVTIQTDAPRFGEIIVTDDGVGMTPAVLARLIHHIGGSAKRSAEGVALGVTDRSDVRLSPGGRYLIGKIGIGLFSVSQLTQRFEIITKTKGDAFRTVASVALRQYADESLAEGSAEGNKFEAGKVAIWREPAIDLDAHGTTIHLSAIRPQARDVLQSRELWNAILRSRSDAGDQGPALDPPRFHVGCIDKDGLLGEFRQKLERSLPWHEEDSPEQAFSAMVDAVWKEAESRPGSPRLEALFDEYLRTMWQLSLSIPTAYVECAPFELTLNELHAAFQLSNGKNGAATRIHGPVDLPISSISGVRSSEQNASDFSVYVDGVRLFRPIKTRGLPPTRAAISRPLLFVGKCREEFARIPRELSTGPLAFTAYLLWSPKIVPKEHQGVLIRVHGASGTGFDSTFMQYQVSELTRLRQIVCEVHVHEGFDSALNIDRESYNQSSPHAVFLARWLHSALRQLATAQKKLAAEIREASRSDAQRGAEEDVFRVARAVWNVERPGDSDGPPPVDAQDDSVPSWADALRVDSSDAEMLRLTQSRSSPALVALADTKLTAIAQVLHAYSLLDDLTEVQRRRLFSAIRAILVAEPNR